MLRNISITLLSVLALTSCDANTRFTNLKCEVFNKSLGEVPVCRLKVLGRGKIGANVIVNIYKRPITNVTMNFSILRKLNGYHPFLYNLTVDFCRYMKHPNPMVVFYYFQRAFQPYSNLNHTCPYNHDVIVNDFVLDDKMFDKLPLPKGNYLLLLKIAINSIWALQISTYMDVDVRQTIRNG